MDLRVTNVSFPLKILILLTLRYNWSFALSQCVCACAWDRQLLSVHTVPELV